MRLVCRWKVCPEACFGDLVLAEVDDRGLDSNQCSRGKLPCNLVFFAAVTPARHGHHFHCFSHGKCKKF